MGEQSISCPTGDLAKSPLSRRLLKKNLCVCMNMCVAHACVCSRVSGSVYIPCVRRQTQVSSSFTLLEIGSTVLCSLHTRLGGLSGGSFSAIGAGITVAPRSTGVLCAKSSPHHHPSGNRPSALVSFSCVKRVQAAQSQHAQHHL